MNNNFKYINNAEDYLKIKYEIELLKNKKKGFLLIKYYNSLNSQIEYLNKEKFKCQNSTFRFVSEKELWNKRNKAYGYWI